MANMKRILIDGDIASYAISAAKVREEVDATAPGEEIEIIIASAGGSIWEGVTIFNIIRAAAKDHKITVLIQGLAASMASYVALAAKMGNPLSTIAVEDNAVYMIHNPYTFALGDYREFLKTGETLNRLSALLALAYMTISKQENKEIRSAMDKETYYIGQEIIDAGFADKIVSATDNSEEDDSGGDSAAAKVALLASAELSIKDTQNRMKQNREPAGLEKVAAFLGMSHKGTNVSAKKNIVSADAGEGGNMNPEELLAKYPECYKAVLARGIEQGAADEKKRAEAHLKMGEAAGSLEISAKYIRGGEGLNDDSVIADYQASAMKKNMLGSRQEDDPGNGNHKPEGDGQTEILASLDKTLGVK